MKRPSVTTRCVADRYHAPSERIVEFNANDGTGEGGLISFRRLADGALRVEVYRCSAHVQVSAPADVKAEPAAGDHSLDVTPGTVA